MLRSIYGRTCVLVIFILNCKSIIKVSEHVANEHLAATYVGIWTFLELIWVKWKNNEVFVRGLHIIGVEDDLTVVDVGDLHHLVSGDVPTVVGVIYDLGVDVKVDIVARSPLDPETGHENDDVVTSVRGRELCE